MSQEEEKNILPPHGPKGEGVDPLTTGEKTYGEDIKGNSTLENGGVFEDATVDASSEAVDEQPKKKRGLFKR